MPEPSLNEYERDRKLMLDLLSEVDPVQSGVGAPKNQVPIAEDPEPLERRKRRGAHRPSSPRQSLKGTQPSTITPQSPPAPVSQGEVIPSSLEQTITPRESALAEKLLYDPNHPEDFFLAPSSTGSPVKYRFSDVAAKEFFIARIGDDWFRMNHFGKIEPEKFSGVEMAGLAKDGRWMLLSETSFDTRTALASESIEPSRLSLEAGRNPLEEIRMGDVWEHRENGKVISQIVIDELAEIKGVKKVVFDQFLPIQKFNIEMTEKDFQIMLREQGYVCDYRRDLDLSHIADKFFLQLPAVGEEKRFGSQKEEILVRGIASGKDTVVYEVVHEAANKKEGPFPYDQMMTYLSQGQFVSVRESSTETKKVGPKNETDLPIEGNPFQYFSSDGRRWQVEYTTDGYKVTNVFTSEELGVFDEVVLRARMTAERWRPAKSIIESGQLQNIETLNRAIETLKKAVELSRSDYVRVEMEEAGAIKSIVKAFRQLAGKTDINPEVRERREAYQGELASIQDLEIQKLKLMGLEGKTLREAIAGVVREYDFEEADRLYDLRQQFSPESKQTWNEKCKALWETTRRNETYFDEYSGFKTREYHDGWKFFAGMLKISGETIAQGVKKVGDQYNAINKTKWGRRAMIVTGVALGGALAFSSGGAAVAFASLVTAKRVVAAAGLGVAADAYLEGRSRRKRGEKAVEKAEEFFGEEANREVDRKITQALESSIPDQEVTGDQFVASEEFYNRFQEWLKQETIDTVSTKQAQLDRGLLYRRSAAILAGFVAAAGIGKLRDFYEYGRDTLPSFGVTTARAAEAANTAASAPLKGAGLPNVDHPPLGAEAAVSSPAGASSAPAGVSQPSAAAIVREVAETRVPGSGLAQATETLLGERKIQSGETIWKYALEGGKAAGLDEKSQTRLATLLREKINEKLATASTSNIKAAGFALNANGQFSADAIQANKTLHLGKLLGKDELAALIEQSKQPLSGTMHIDKSYATLEEAARDAARTYGKEMAAQELTPSGRVDDIALEEGARAMQEAGIERVVASPASVAGVTEAVISTAAAPERIAGLGKTVSVVDYIRELPREEQGEIFRTMRRTVRDLFDTPETNIFGSNTTQYLFSDHPEFARVPAAKVLADHAILQNSSLFFYDRSVNPLHWTQMQEVAKFSESAVKTLGKDIGAPFNNESIESYVLRITTAARGLGKSLPSFRMLN